MNGEIGNEKREMQKEYMINERPMERSVVNACRKMRSRHLKNAENLHYRQPVCR